MRITNNTMTTTFMRNLNRNLSQMQKYHNQLSSGKLVSKPSDNPLLVAKIMDLNNFDENILTNEEEITPSFTIGLLHKPDEFEKLKNYDIDVIFAGHSLGGQLRLPFWGATLYKRLLQ